MKNVWVQVYTTFAEAGKLDNYHQEDPVGGGLIWIEITGSDGRCNFEVFTLLGDEVRDYLLAYISNYIEVHQFCQLGNFRSGFMVNAFGPPLHLNVK